MDLVEEVARSLAAASWELHGNETAEGPFVERRWPHYVEQAKMAVSVMAEHCARLAEAQVAVAWTDMSQPLVREDAAAHMARKIAAVIRTSAFHSTRNQKVALDPTRITR